MFLQTTGQYPLERSCSLNSTRTTISQYEYTSCSEGVGVHQACTKRAPHHTVASSRPKADALLAEFESLAAVDANWCGNDACSAQESSVNQRPSRFRGATEQDNNGTNSLFLPQSSRRGRKNASSDSIGIPSHASPSEPQRSGPRADQGTSNMPADHTRQPTLTDILDLIVCATYGHVYGYVNRPRYGLYVYLCSLLARVPRWQFR